MATEKAGPKGAGPQLSTPTDVASVSRRPDFGRQWERVGGAPSRNRDPRPPRQAGSVFALMPFYGHGTVEQRRMWRRTMLEARQAALWRRRRVLAHPDLADRLARSLRLHRASNWNGYVPPRLYDTRYGPVVNTSPYRREVVAILVEVDARERAA